MGNFLRKFCYTFSILLIFPYFSILWNTLNSCLLEYVTVFPIKNNFQLVNMTFYFDLVLQFYFLKWNRFFSTFIPVLTEHVTTLTTYYHGKCVLIYKLKDFRLWNFDTQFEITGVLISQVTILKSTHFINVYSFWNCLSRNLLLIKLIAKTLF